MPGPKKRGYEMVIFISHFAIVIQDKFDSLLCKYRYNLKYVLYLLKYKRSKRRNLFISMKWQ